MHVYTRRKKTADVQSVEQQVEQPQLVAQQHSSAGDVEIGDDEVEQSIETGEKKSTFPLVYLFDEYRPDLPRGSR